MRTLALITFIFAIAATAAAALWLRRAQSPNAAYRAAMLGIVAICTFIASLLILALAKA
jgi:hypothetical protein